jgi:hypothetical protein
MKYFLYISSIAFICFNFSSCKKDPPLDVKKETNTPSAPSASADSKWIPYDGFKYYDKLLINSYSDDHSIAFLSANSCYYMDDQNGIQCSINTPSLPITYPGKFPINNRFFAFHEDSWMEIVPWTKEVDPLYLNLKSYDSTFYETLPMWAEKHLGFVIHIA